MIRIVNIITIARAGNLCFSNSGPNHLDCYRIVMGELSLTRIVPGL